MGMCSSLDSMHTGFFDYTATHLFDEIPCSLVTGKQCDRPLCATIFLCLFCTTFDGFTAKAGGLTLKGGERKCIALVERFEDRFVSVNRLLSIIHPEAFISSPSFGGTFPIKYDTSPVALSKARKFYFILYAFCISRFYMFIFPCSCIGNSFFLYRILYHVRLMHPT